MSAEEPAFSEELLDLYYSKFPCLLHPVVGNDSPFLPLALQSGSFPTMSCFNGSATEMNRKESTQGT